MTTMPPSRHIALQGTTNFRDLGGYVGHNGGTVRWRKLFRSDHLAGLSTQDLQQLQALGVRRSADFRGQQERTVDRYEWPQWSIHTLSVEPTVVQKAFALVQAGGSLSAPETVALMQETYRNFVDENASRFAALFQLLLEQDEPLVFHCTAGKDRTGWAAALILHALGVSQADVVHDYLLTNQFYQRPAAAAARVAAHVPQEILHVLWRVQPEFLESAYAQVQQRWGSMDAYLRDAMQLDDAALAHLRGLYLQPAA